MDMKNSLIESYSLVSDYLDTKKLNTALSALSRVFRGRGLLLYRNHPPPLLLLDSVDIKGLKKTTVITVHKNSLLFYRVLIVDRNKKITKSQLH